MEIRKFNTLEQLKHENKVSKLLYKKVSDILETDISFSFRIFTDSGKDTLYFYEFKKIKCCGNCAFFFHESTSGHGICDKSNKSVSCNSKICNFYKYFMILI